VVTGEALRVEEVEKFFPPALTGWRTLLHPLAALTVPALRGISFTATAGEILVLVGANGAGKSTLLRILTTLLLPSRGRAWIGGVDLLQEPARVRQQIGFHSGSDASFYARLSARENLRFFASLNNISRIEADRGMAELADWLGLADAMDRQVRTFSTGMVHRLGLARALLHRPSLLILDEPTRSLDPIAAAEFRRFLRDEVVGRRGTTLLFASHTLIEIEQLAGRALLLDHGRLIACDTVERIRASAGAGTLEQAIEILVRRSRVAS
jgi:ABC-2 type transport system ATP-binding protein